MIDNSIMIIQPYYKGTWVFDDEASGLFMEPFVSGVPEMIDDLVKKIPDASYGFRLLFSDSKFPGSSELKWVKAEHDGNWYEYKGMIGWLCPAMFKYFKETPLSIWVKAEELE